MLSPRWLRWTWKPLLAVWTELLTWLTPLKKLSKADKLTTVTKSLVNVAGAVTNKLSWRINSRRPTTIRPLTKLKKIPSKQNRLIPKINLRTRTRILPPMNKTVPTLSKHSLTRIPVMRLLLRTTLKLLPLLSKPFNSSTPSKLTPLDSSNPRLVSEMLLLSSRSTLLTNPLLLSSLSSLCSLSLPLPQLKSINLSSQRSSISSNSSSTNSEINKLTTTPSTPALLILLTSQLPTLLLLSRIPRPLLSTSTADSAKSRTVLLNLLISYKALVRWSLPHLPNYRPQLIHAMDMNLTTLRFLLNCNSLISFFLF